MSELDLDKLRGEREAARREANQEPPTLRFGGESFVLPVELPLDLAWALAEGTSGRVICQELLGPDAYKRFMELGPTREDWIALDEWLGAVYLPKPAEASTLGKSPSSGDS